MSWSYAWWDMHPLDWEWWRICGQGRRRSTYSCLFANMAKDLRLHGDGIVCMYQYWSTSISLKQIYLKISNMLFCHLPTFVRIETKQTNIEVWNISIIPSRITLQRCPFKVVLPCYKYLSKHFSTKMSSLLQSIRITLETLQVMPNHL